MRVLIIADSFPPFISGVTIHILELCQRLKKSGAKVKLIAPQYPDSNFEYSKYGLTSKDIEFLSSFAVPYDSLRISLPAPIKVRKIIDEFKPDIIDISAPSFTAIDVILANSTRKIPLFGSFHTLFSNEQFTSLILKIGRTKFFQNISLGYEFFVYKKCDLIGITNSSYKRLLISHSIDAEKIVEFNPLTPMKPLKHPLLTIQDCQKIKSKLNLKSKVILSFGRLATEKNLDILLQAFKLVTLNHKDVSLLILGSGPAMPFLKSLTSDLKLEEDVKFYGQYEIAKIIEEGIFEISNLSINLSQIETFSLTTLESMMNSVPVILARGTGIQEYMNGTEALICELSETAVAESIITVLEDSDYRNSLIKNAKMFSQQFDPDLAFEKLLINYKNCIERSSNVT